MNNPWFIRLPWFIGRSGRDEMSANRDEGLGKFLELVWVERDRTQGHDPRVRSTGGYPNEWTKAWAAAKARWAESKIEVTKLPAKLRNVA